MQTRKQLSPRIRKFIQSLRRKPSMQIPDRAYMRMARRSAKWNELAR